MTELEFRATPLRADEASVEARSAVLKRELGLPDLVFTQILFIVGLPWVGVAAKLGPAHLIFWLVAMAFFYVPSAAVVIYLNRLMPDFSSRGTCGCSPSSTHRRSGYR